MKRYEVYGGTGYSSDFRDIPAPDGIDVFDNLNDALEEFRYRQDFGRTRQGLKCPLWDVEETGGIIETDDDGNAIDLHRGDDSIRELAAEVEWKQLEGDTE